MSGVARRRSMNMSDSEARPVLGPGQIKNQKMVDVRKPILRPLKEAGKSTEEVLSEAEINGVLQPAICRHESLLSSNLSMSASCSSDASTDSFSSRASTGRMCRTSSKTSRKKQLVPKPRNGGDPNGVAEGVEAKRRCSWVTTTTDACYVAFHDEEWGVPAHDDKKLFEYLVLSGALAELTWPAILSKRHIFREVFADFDPIAVAKLSEKKIITPGSPASSLLSELKLRSIIENARQVSKVIDEFGSFDKYIWSFVNHKPIVSSFRYPRQVPVKTPKADVISKDLIRRGFRSVGPTVVYSFMQVAGITNDHLISCFRFHGCGAAAALVKEQNANKQTEMEICRSIDELSLSSQ
ncbi:DNA-3-methyladenine glycosylase I [Handroanthus impetiginosus]|uniref:DNA-3-methyladenine glycosylase I n=1 Tax=Handroanthus impetiginosus TaxID=429701 RepID=A0A2G9G6M3_9LAMI|nr:DNA-3-methyladenine glycosylase I [Handroanthus impetiginosus]